MDHSQPHPSPAAPSREGRRVTTLRGRRLVVTDDKPSFWDKAAAGTWEPELLAALEGLVRPGDVFLDIGAWVGPTSLFAALLGAEVVSVEADPRAAELLRANFAANPALAARLHVIERAASPNAGKLRLGAPRKQGDSMSSALLGNLANSWEVETIQPESLMETVKAAGEGSLVVKIDIEGGEYALLPALAPLLTQGRMRAALVAFHPGLLREGGRPDAEIAAATARCFEAMATWRARMVDIDSEDPPAVVAAQQNSTVLFTPLS
jgi:FkbM family methyltransferase